MNKSLGGVSSVVPTEDANAGDVRACYRATTTCPDHDRVLPDATYLVR
jgi:hypothetical protein